MRNKWAEDNLPRLDKRLFVVFDKENGWWEVWLKMRPGLPIPRDANEAEEYQFRFCNGDYYKLMNCIMPDGAIADPGPWLAEVLAYWDTRRGGRQNILKWWKAGHEHKEKEKANQDEEFKEQIKYYKRAIQKGLEEKFGGGDIRVEPDPTPKMKLRRVKSYE
jgi:hypothetical protein